MAPKTRDDYRAVPRSWRRKISFTIPNDKLIHVGITEIAISNPEEEVREDLKEMGFHPKSVSHITSNWKSKSE